MGQTEGEGGLPARGKTNTRASARSRRPRRHDNRRNPARDEKNGRRTGGRRSDPSSGSRNSVSARWDGSAHGRGDGSTHAPNEVLARERRHHDDTSWALTPAPSPQPVRANNLPVNSIKT